MNYFNFCILIFFNTIFFINSADLLNKNEITVPFVLVIHKSFKATCERTKTEIMYYNAYPRDIKLSELKEKISEWLKKSYPEIFEIIKTNCPGGIVLLTKDIIRIKDEDFKIENFADSVIYHVLDIVI